MRTWNTIKQTAEGFWLWSVWEYLPKLPTLQERHCLLIAALRKHQKSMKRRGKIPTKPMSLQEIRRLKIIEEQCPHPSKCTKGRGIASGRTRSLKEARKNMEAVRQSLLLVEEET